MYTYTYCGNEKEINEKPKLKALHNVKGRKKCQVVVVDMSAWLKSWHRPRQGGGGWGWHVACHKNNPNGSNKSHFVSMAIHYVYHYWNFAYVTHVNYMNQTPTAVPTPSPKEIKGWALKMPQKKKIENKIIIKTKIVVCVWLLYIHAEVVPIYIYKLPIHKGLSAKDTHTCQ